MNPEKFYSPHTHWGMFERPNPHSYANIQRERDILKEAMIRNFGEKMVNELLGFPYDSK